MYIEAENVAASLQVDFLGVHISDHSLCAFHTVAADYFTAGKDRISAGTERDASAGRSGHDVATRRRETADYGRDEHGWFGMGKETSVPRHVPNEQ